MTMNKNFKLHKCLITMAGRNIPMCDKANQGLKPFCLISTDNNKTP